MPSADADLRTTDIFNSAVAASAVAAAWDLGALDALNECGEIVVSEFAERNDLHRDTVIAMFAAMASVRIVRRHGDRVVPDRNFAGVFEAKGLFHWLSRGCAELFAGMTYAARNANRTGTFYRRDAAAISHACRDINRTYFDAAFWKAMGGLDFTAVADLGCGSGERIIEIIRARPGVYGIGVDIAPDALRVAEESVAAAGLADQVTLIAMDARGLDPHPRFEQVDLVTCFLMGHDLWPRERCIASLRRIRAAFPNVRRFLLGDGLRTVGAPDTDPPLFTVGFETAHAIMGVYLPTRDEWAEVFAEGGWACVERHDITTLATAAVFELAPADKP